MDATSLRSLVEYHYWARDRVLDACAALDADAYTRDLGTSFGSVRGTLNHTYGAEVVWLRRWNGESPTAFPGDLPDTLDALREAWRTQEQALRAHLDRAGDNGVATVMRYRTFAGLEGESALWQMVVHVVNHATYHRGQVTTLLRLLNAAPPASTDLIAFYRERGPTPPSTPRIVHFEIHASDPEALATYYRALFGWQIARWGEMPYWAVTTGSGTAGINGGIVPRRGAAPLEGQAVNAAVCTVNVPSVDDALAHAAALGGSVVVPKMAIPTIGWLAYFKDPDGNILGLMADDPTAR